MTLYRGPGGDLLRGPGGDVANNMNCCCGADCPTDCSSCPGTINIAVDDVGTGACASPDIIKGTNNPGSLVSGGGCVWVGEYEIDGGNEINLCDIRCISGVWSYFIETPPQGLGLIETYRYSEVADGAGDCPTLGALTFTADDSAGSGCPATITVTLS